MGKFLDLTGKRFGKLTAYCFAHVELSSGRKMPAWLCICDCGNKKIIQGHHLRGGKTTSCGCAASDWMKKEGGPRKDWPEYGVFCQMINRCENPNVKSYKHYGARGIRVCRRWRRGDGVNTGFECFVADMGRRPEGLTLERNDPNGHYEPSNCRWATPQEQRLNTRRSIHASIAGRKIPLVKYAARTGLAYELIRVRVRKGGMSVTEAARDLLRSKRLSEAA